MKDFADLLTEAKEKHPHLRIGQIIVAALGAGDNESIGLLLTYIQDEELKANLQRFLQNDASDPK